MCNFNKVLGSIVLIFTRCVLGENGFSVFVLTKIKLWQILNVYVAKCIDKNNNCINRIH